MVLRKNNKSLTKTEISIIKRLHNDGMNNQEILGVINSKKLILTPEESAK